MLNAVEALGTETRLTNDADEIRKADGIILPGVGAFGEGMEALRSRGLLPVLQEEVVTCKKPYLGICLGLQFLAGHSEEHGKHEGLGWVKGKVIRMEPEDKSVKVPHMGWNDTHLTAASPLFDGLRDDPVFYFVHSYHIVLEGTDETIVTATSDNGMTVTAAVQKGENIFGVQFHPEKSQSAGLLVLKNFINLCNQPC